MRLFIFLLLLVSSLNAQPVNKYFIRFTDKNNSSFSVNNPSGFLSLRAIERRAKANIPIDESDIPVNSSYLDSVKSLGAVVYTTSKWFNGATIECDTNVLNAVRALPFVLSASKVFRIGTPSIHKYIESGIPFNEQSILKSTGLNEGFGNSFNQIHLMNGEFLHENGFNGEGVQIAVIDDGFFSVNSFTAFEKLRNENRILGTYDFVSNETSVYEDDSHGMSVLSTIAGYVPGQLIGTAPQASFYLLRSEDAGSENIIEEYNWNAAAEFADSAGADVITSSLGYTEFDDASTNHVYADMDGDHCPSSIAADFAVAKGMLVLTSAGNSGSSAWHYIGAPSDGDNVISVGAVDSVGRRASFTSYGPASDGDVKPNLVAKGVKSTLSNSSGGISTGNGTSFACPILAGAAACLWQRFPSKTNMEIKDAMEKSANYFLTPNDSFGYGIPDFRIASYFLSTENGELPKADEIVGIYPNPFSDAIHIRFYASTSEVASIELFDQLGKLILRNEKSVKGGYLNTIDINSGIPAAKGIYFLRILANDKSHVKMLVQQ